MRLKHHRKEALAAFEQAAQANPEDPWSLYGQGYLLHKSGRREEARAVCMAAVALCDRRIAQDAHDSEMFAIKGHVLQLLRRHEEALASYEEAIRLDPSTSNYAGRMSALWSLHQYRACWRAFKIAVHRSSS